MSNVLLKNDFAQVTLMNMKQQANLEDSYILKLSHVNCAAKVSLYAGQVLSYQPTGHKDILWLSEQASYKKGNAIRGGIPVCWPWFGPIDSQKLKQAESNASQIKPQKHGFARQLTWDIASINADDSGITLVLTLSGNNNHPVWPNAFKLTQTLFFGKSFKQSLAMTNLAEEDTQYSAALHSYFLVSNPKGIAIDALTGVKYLDELTATKGLQKESVSCVGEIDRKYQSHEAMTLVDKKWQRKINIISHNCQEWILWNPGTSVAEKMDDVHLGGEHEYVCLEPGNTRPKILPAGETVTIAQEIHVESI